MCLTHCARQRRHKDRRGRGEREREKSFVGTDGISDVITANKHEEVTPSKWVAEKRTWTICTSICIEKGDEETLSSFRTCMQTTTTLNRCDKRETFSVDYSCQRKDHTNERMSVYTDMNRWDKRVCVWTIDYCWTNRRIQSIFIVSSECVLFRLLHSIDEINVN
jgi:hypothetical protein